MRGNSIMKKSYRDDNGEKIFRYSIRKYHFGAASVAVAALMFFANGAVAAHESITPATASDVVTAGSDGNADGDSGASDEGDSKKALTDQPAELKPADELKAKEALAEGTNQGQAGAESNSAQSETNPTNQEPSQAEGEKEQDQPAAANTEAAKSTQGNLQALLEKLTLSSMQELHAEVEARLAAAKAVLDDPKATQEQVDEQARLMAELTGRVNQALTPSLETPTILENAGLTSTAPASNELASPEGAVTNQASRGKRRRGGGLSAAAPAATQDAPSAGGNSTTPGASSQATPRELPTYTNTTEGKNGVWGLKAELEFIADQLRTNGASADKIQAAKAAADKFNEAFSKGDTISQEDFSAALADLKKSRDLIEGVLSENEANAGEVTGPVNPAESATPSENNVTIQPRTNTRGWSGFRNVPAGVQTRNVRSADRSANGSFIDAKRHYFDNDFDITSPYTNYTYVYWNKKRENGPDKPDDVADIINYLKEDVERTSTGFRWRITVNPSHKNLDKLSFLFTIPSGQTLKSNSVTITKQTDQGSTSFNRTASDGKDELVSTMEAAGFGEVTKGTPDRTNAPRTTTAFLSKYDYKVDSVLGWIRDEVRGGFYNRGNPRDANATNGFENQAEQDRSNEKAQIVANSSGNTYYGRLEGNTAYQIEFETTGGNDEAKLVYMSSIKGVDREDNPHRILALQIHARTDKEVGSAGNFRFELRKNGYFQVDQDNIAAEFGTRAWDYSTNHNGRTYQSVPNGDFDATDSRVKGIITYTKTDYIWNYNDFDIRNYGIYKDKSGALISNGYTKAEKDKQKFEFYKGTTTTTTEEITTEVATKPGVHTYNYRRYFADGSQDKGTIHFVTKPKRPMLDTDFSGLDEGRHNITASNGTEGYKMVLFKKESNGSLTKVAEKLAGADGRATFENVDVKLGEYLVKTVVDGEWSDYKIKDAQGNDTRRKTVESDESNLGKTKPFKMGVTTDGSTIKQEHTIKYPVNDNVSNNSIKFIAKGAQNIKSLTVTGGEAAGIVWKTDGLNTQTATIRAENGSSGFAPNKAGVYKLTVTATSTDNSTQTYTARLFIAPSKGSLATRDSALQGKANEQPTVNANRFPSGLATNFTDGNTRLEWKALLVKGGQNNPQSYIQEAINYEIVASAPLKPNGTAEFTSANYKKDKIGTDSVRVIMALVKSGTDEVYEGITSSLSDNSVRATLPDFSKAPEFGRDETGFTAKIGHLNANKAELRYTDGTGTERTVGFSKVGANWEKDKPNQNTTIAVTADTSGGTATVHIPFGTAKLGTDLKAKQKAADTNFSTESTYHVPADSSAPKVSLGDTLLPTTEAAANQVLYRVKQGQDFIPKIKVWDDTGSITKLVIENTPAGVTLNKFNNNFTAQTNADERNKYTGSTISGKVATTQRAGEHVAKITAKDAYNHEQTYYLRYQILPSTVEAKQAKFGQVYGKALLHGEDSANYVQFKDNGTNVDKPAGVDVAWQTKPSTAVAGLDKIGRIKITYHVTDENGTVTDQVEYVDIKTPVYHATVKNNGIYETTFGTAFGSSTNAGPEYVTPNITNHLHYYWESKGYRNNQRDLSANYLGKKKDSIQVLYPNDAGQDAYDNFRSETLPIYFVVKPVKPTVEGVTSTATSLTVNNVNSGTTVELYDMSNPDQPQKIGEKVVAQEGEFNKKDKINVPLLAGKTLNPGAKIVAKVVYTSGSDKTESDNSDEVVVKHPKPANLTSTVKMNGDYEFTVPTDADKITFNIPTKNGGTKAVTLTSSDGWASTDTAVKKVGNKLVIPNGTLGTTNRTVNIIETKGSGDAESASNNYGVTIPAHTAPTLSDVIVAAGATPTAEQISDAFTKPTKRSLAAKSALAAVPAGTSAQISATLTYSDGSTEDVTITVKSKPTAPTFDNVEDHGGAGRGISSTSKVISGSATPGASKVKLTLQNGTVRELTPNAEGKWSYTLQADEILTQNFTTAKHDTYNPNKVKAVQVKDDVESEAANIDIAIGKPSLDSVYKAGRSITVNVAHDALAGYIRVNGADYGIIKKVELGKL